MKRSLSQLGAAILLTLVPLAGQSTQELTELDRDIARKQGELQRVRSEIRLYEARIARQERAEVDVLNRLFALEERISLASRLIRALGNESQQLTKAINLTQDLIRKSQTEIATLKSKLSERFVHIYKQRRASLLELVLASENWNQATYRAKYLKAAADYDRFLTAKVKSEIARLEAQQQRLARDRARKQEALREREQEETRLRASKTRRRQQIETIKRDRRSAERMLLQKKQAVVALERIITTLEFDREKRSRELAARRRDLDLAVVPDISYYRGKLPWPITGRVTARFGLQRNPRLNTVTENPGIDISAAAGSPVRAVLDGLVTTVTYLRGYGTTVIIDHGKNLYTVYTHLEEITVAEENYVDQGQIIAQVGTDGSLDGAKLHFEVWANQQKQDPGLWLTSRP